MNIIEVWTKNIRRIYKRDYFDCKFLNRWFYKDKPIHRTDGPAITYSNGMIRYYYDGRWIHDSELFILLTNMTEEDFLALVLKYGEF